MSDDTSVAPEIAVGTFTLETMPEIGKLPKAVYRVNCLSIESEVSKNNNNMLVCQFEVLSPETVADGDTSCLTAGTKFKAWFVWSASSAMKPNLLALKRGFQLPSKAWTSVKAMEDEITNFMLDNAVGSTFLWRLYSEPEFKREAFTKEEIENGAKYDEAKFILDDQGEKILAMHKVNAQWSEIIGKFERLQTA